MSTTQTLGVNKTIYHYVVEVIGGVEPELHGPLDTEDDRQALAKTVHAKQDPETDATFWLDVTERDDGRRPIVEIGSYSAQFFEDSEDVWTGAILP